MNESDMTRLVRDIIRQELAPIIMAKIVSTEDVNRVTVQRYPMESAIRNLRNIQPYGIASRPPDDMDTLVVPIGGDPTHLNVVGQFDVNRPAVGPGEVCFYGPNGQQIWMGVDGDIRNGSKTAASPAVLGDILKTFVDNLLKAFLEAPQIGTCAVGPVMLDPSIRQKLMAEKEQRVDSADTNFLAQKTFVDRGV